MSGYDIPQNPYLEFTYVIPAAANGLNRQKIFYYTNYFRVLSLTANTLSVNFAGITQSTIIGAGIGIELPNAIPWIELTNTGSSDITVTVALGVGKFNDNRFVASGSISSSITPGATLADAADVAVLTTATTQVIAANAATKTVIISNLLANNIKIRVGTSSAAAARGVEVPIGGSIAMDTSAAVYVYNPSVSTINIGVLSIRT